MSDHGHRHAGLPGFREQGGNLRPAARKRQPVGFPAQLQRGVPAHIGVPDHFKSFKHTLQSLRILLVNPYYFTRRHGKKQGSFPHLPAPPED